MSRMLGIFTTCDLKPTVVSSFRWRCGDVGGYIKSGAGAVEITNSELAELVDELETAREEENEVGDEQVRLED